MVADHVSDRGSRKGISSNQLHRTLGFTLKTAWFMSRRIRDAMRDVSTKPFGGEGGDVQMDETYTGTLQGVENARGDFRHKMRVFHFSTTALTAPVQFMLLALVLAKSPTSFPPTR